jgi:hypothetical protein
MRPLDKPSKAGLFSIIFGVIGLLGPLLSVFGLILRVLKWRRIIYFEGTVGFGGIAGGLALIIGIAFGLVALILGIKATRKARQGVALVGGRKSAVAGIILGVVSAALPILLFIPIALTFGI